LFEEDSKTPTPQICAPAEKVTTNSTLPLKKKQQQQQQQQRNINIEPGSATTLEGKARQDFKLAFRKTKRNRDSGGEIANVSLKHFRRIIEETSRL